MGNEQLTEPGRSSAVDAPLQPPETVGSRLCDDPHPPIKTMQDLTS